MLFDSISQIILGSLSFRCYLNATLRIKNLLFKTNFALVFCLYWVQTKFTNLMYDKAIVPFERLHVDFKKHFVVDFN